ncbi:MAG TPA: isoprenylcysteine carboxylmethyltransferase family protein [Thermoanaerobaculia bacterium]
MSNPLARIVGAPPIHPVPFALAKVATGVSLGVLALAVLRHRKGRRGLPLSVAVPLAAAGGALIAAGSMGLGSSLRVGLPEEKTELRTDGIYARTRNPIYLGVFVAVGASALAVPTPLNLLAAGTAVAAHHAIVGAEERFLRERFGEAWDAYARRVPRYL